MGMKYFNWLFFLITEIEPPFYVGIDYVYFCVLCLLVFFLFYKFFNPFGIFILIFNIQFLISALKNLKKFYVVESICHYSFWPCCHAKKHLS